MKRTRPTEQAKRQQTHQKSATDFDLLIVDETHRLNARLNPSDSPPFWG